MPKSKVTGVFEQNSFVTSINSQRLLTPALDYPEVPGKHSGQKLMKDSEGSGSPPQLQRISANRGLGRELKSDKEGTGEFEFWLAWR